MKLFFTLVLACFSFGLFAQNSSKFIYGNGIDKWGVPLKIPDSELSVRLGGRFQSLTSATTEEFFQTNSSTTEQDFQSRRVRLNFEASFRDFRYYMDLRNDRSNRGDSGEGGFTIGDAYVYKPLLQTASGIHAVKFFRAKVDVSRTQTASSSEILFVNRPQISDFAADFVTEGRRATNFQFIGRVFDQLTYQLVVGDGVFSGDFLDARGNGINAIQRQNFMLGGKLRFSPFKDWVSSKVKETYFGEGKHLEIGAGFFNTSNIFIQNDAGLEGSVSRNLINLEFSAHYYEWFLQAEYFLFDGMIENHNAITSFNVGKGEGWYIQGEKVFSDFYWLAPFARFESWNRFQTSGDYLSTAQLYGLNWYANGNRFKVGVVYEVNTNGRDTTLADRVETYHIATAWNF